METGTPINQPIDVETETPINQPIDVDAVFGTDPSTESSYESRQYSTSEEDEEVVSVNKGMANESAEENEVEYCSINEEFLKEGPKTGMVFRSKEHVIAAYQAYAKNNGFSTAIRTTKNGKYILITCHKARKSTAKKFSQRIGCQARLNAKELKNFSWKVTVVHLDHNHELDPSNSVFLAAHRVLQKDVMSQLENFDIAGLSTAKSIRLLEVQAGGPGKLGCLKKDCRNYIEKRRRLRLGAGDAEAIHRLFLRLQKTEPNFFHLMDINDEGRLRNVMWIHPRSMAAYKEFHEVVSFDTTYLVNKYDMPFATVVGVNHHHQSILLGCALLSRENSDSFKWFWNNWLEAMGNVAPTAILTDQCDGIKNALMEVMPNTVHRLCIWHILSKVPKKFKKTPDPREAGRDFSELVYGSITILELETRWKEFVEKHNLKENRWLSDLWDVRESWIPVYLNHIFWAGMKSTQRSESMHAFFDGYIHSRSSLKQFVEQYDLAIQEKVWSEMKADHDSKNKVIMCFTDFEWEAQFQKVYTNAIFGLVQVEVKGMMVCDIRNECVVLGDIEKFEVVDSGLMSKYHKQITYTVVYKPIEEYIECDCKKFNSMGILCRHVMKVLMRKGIGKVHERYILRRWRKDVYRRHSNIFFAGGYPRMTKDYMMRQDVDKSYKECTDKSYQNEERIKFLKACLDECSVKLDSMSSVIDIEDERGSHGEGDGEGEDSQNIVLDPVQIKRRGRPRKATRLKPVEEIVKDKLKAKNTSKTKTTKAKTTKAKTTKTNPKVTRASTKKQ